MIPEIRNALHQWKMELEKNFVEPSNILIQLENLFYNLQVKKIL